MAEWSKFALWVLLILFMFIFIFALYSKEGLMSRIANLALGAQRFLPIEPSKEIKADESLSKEVIEVQKNFINTIYSSREQGECILPLNSLEGLDDFEMEVSYFKKIRISILKPVGKEGNIKLNTLEGKDESLKICLLDPSNFINCYIYNKPQLCTKMHKNVDLLHAKNGVIIIEGEEYAIVEDILFKTDKNNVCFIPKNKGWVGCPANEITSQGRDCIALIRNKIAQCS